MLEQQSKEKRFFEYLLELTKLSSKSVRDYTRFDDFWSFEEFVGLEGVSVGTDCKNEENFLEIYKPILLDEEKIHPKVPKIIEKWIDFNPKDVKDKPTYISSKSLSEEDGQEYVEYFDSDIERKQAYLRFEESWLNWSKNLDMKKKVIKLYNDFFELVTRFDREGESIELVLGRGLLVWKHEVGLIKAPLLTQKMEINLFADKNVITITSATDKIKQESEMLSGIQVHNKIKAEKTLSDFTAEDMKEDLSEQFTEFVRLIHPDGNYNEKEKELFITDYPQIFDHKIFVLRKKSVRVLREDLENILQKIDSNELKINEAINSLLGNETNFLETGDVDSKENSILPKDILFFPLESNEQQKDIVKRINNNFGVTVQGPPGTGKTHTIANLVSHFLAEGKRVLITSQKENPLRVLKNKIPESIRELCVPVLGGGKDSLREIEQSINTIGEKLGELDPQKLERDVKRNLISLDTSKRKEMELFNHLKEYSQKEGTVLQYKDEELYRYEVAKLLADTEVEFEWFSDEIGMDKSLPISLSDFERLKILHRDLKKEDLLLNSKKIPGKDDGLLSESEFANLINNGVDLSLKNEDGESFLSLYNLPEDSNQINSLLEKLEILSDRKEIFQNKSLLTLMEDLKAGGTREIRWRNFLDELIHSIEKMLGQYNELVGYEIKLPEKPLSVLKEDILQAIQRLESGKKPDFLYKLAKGKRVKYLFEQNVINQQPITNLNDAKMVQLHLEYYIQRLDTTRVFNANMNDIGHALIEERVTRFPQTLQKKHQELMVVIETFDLIKELQNTLFVDNVNLYSPQGVELVAKHVSQTKNYLAFKQWELSFFEMFDQLNRLAQDNDFHPIIKELVKAFENQDINEWNNLHSKLKEMHKIRTKVNEFYQLLNVLELELPLTSTRIEHSLNTNFVWIKDFTAAFEYKKLKTWLDETSDVNSTKIRNLIDKEKRVQIELIQEIVRDSAWKSQIERITDSQKRALSSWKSSIKRYGGGTGKNKRFLKNIRESMVEAQSAIPVWIMPISQVLENFPITNEKFDVIIFDESSQCDLFSTNVLLRSKKVIVVGDDEQISPQSVGVNHDDIVELQKKYLYDIPNAGLMDGNISLYEIAEQTFPKTGKLMLREHFRCVPEIIQFSNDLSYSGQMIPMRLPLEVEKIHPPVLAIKVNDGYNDEGNKDINLPEAEKIAEDILEIVNNPKYDNQSIGVITLQGNEQHKLLENLIRDKIGDAEYVARKIICGNAYNLQGDERDIIFLSMVIAPGRRWMSLVKLADRQRYNVAASRARNQMRLYHSIDLNDLSSKDYRHRLLSYCKNPSRVQQQFEDLESLCDSPFEKDVLLMILARGYRVTPQVKIGAYRIDLVVEGVRDRLAVECDGEKWHGPEKFEEDMIRQESLERAGWKFWRIRGREFYFDKAGSMESLWARLDELGIEPFKSEPTKISGEDPKGKAFDVSESELKSNLEDTSIADLISDEFKSPVDGQKSDIIETFENTRSASEEVIQDEIESEYIVQEEFVEKEIAFKNKISDDSVIVDRKTEPPKVMVDSISISEQLDLLDEPLLDNHWLSNMIKENNFETVDKRDKGGSLWIVGGPELESFFKKLSSKGYDFKFTEKGSRATKHKPGWYSKNL